MGVYPTDAFTPKPAFLNKCQHFVVTSRFRCGESTEVRQHACALTQTSASELADNKRMRKDLLLFKDLGEFVVASTKMIDPDGGVDENQRRRLERLRGIACIFGSLPPNEASRFAASRAIKAFKPS